MTRWLPAPSMRLTGAGGSEEVLVYLLATEADVRAFTGTKEQHLQAACDHVSSRTWPHVLAVVYLPLDTMGSGLVAHELGHATFRVMNTRGLTMVANEETFCLVLDSLTKQFWNQYYEKEETAWKTAAATLIAESDVRA